MSTKYRGHHFDLRMTSDQDKLERCLNSPEGEIIAIIPNVTWFLVSGAMLQSEHAQLEVLARYPLRGRFNEASQQAMRDYSAGKFNTARAPRTEEQKAQAKSPGKEQDKIEQRDIVATRSCKSSATNPFRDDSGA